MFIETFHQQVNWHIYIHQGLGVNPSNSAAHKIIQVGENYGNTL